MNKKLAFETGRLQIKRFIHENGGRDARVLFLPGVSDQLCGKYFDRSSRRCEISINPMGKDLAAAVRDAMLNPTILS